VKGSSSSTVSVACSGRAASGAARTSSALTADLEYTPAYDLARGVADYVESLRRLDLQPTAKESESSWSTGSALPGAGPSST
jgi:hypothetical protein